MSYRVAMDIGGTFTDFVMIDEGSQVTSTGKTSTTPASPEQGVLEGLTQVVPELPAISFIVHGTTVGLNAFLERKGTRVLLVMTAGLRDAYSIARHDRKELYTLRYRKPERLVPRRDVYEVTERLREPAPKVCELLEDASEELLCFYAFPREHWPKLRSTNPLERVNKEIGRRSDVVGIYPNDEALIRLAGMLLIEQNDEWLVQCRYVSEHSMRLILSEAVQIEPTTDTEKKEEVIELTAA